MFLLPLACTPAETPAPPLALALGVKLPPAQHASALRAARFVGPLDVAGLDAAALCGEPDLAALLREGRYGWRVLGLSGGSVRLPDGTVEPLEGATPGAEALAARWVAADKAYADVCGRAPDTALLLTPDADAATRVPSRVLGAFGRSRYTPAEAFLLVDDPTPDTPLAAPTPRGAGPFAKLAMTRASTWLLWSEPLRRGPATSPPRETRSSSSRASPSRSMSSSLPTRPCRGARWSARWTRSRAAGSRSASGSR